ncbi:hypothetical protein [Aeromicrobium sp. P5_D10]
MTTKTAWVAGSAAIAFALMVAGCSSASQDIARSPEARPRVLQNDVSRDYDIQPSVRSVRDTTSYAIAGKVAAWHEGPMIDVNGYANMYAILELDSAQAFKAPAPHARPTFVRVELGTLPVDDDGNVVELEAPDVQYTALSVDDVKKAIPRGTRVLLLAEEVMSDDPENPEFNPKVLRDWMTSDGSPLLEPHPQGLLVETAKGNYDSGVAETADVSHGQWPASPGYAGSISDGTFEALLRDVQQGS